jgi:cytochrome c oxidase assembly protein subunit 15
MKRIINWLPTTVDARVRFMAWTTFVVQTLIVVTGGAVRLTASGLGCPTWPQCTAESLVTTPEMGWHGVIEFGNRLLTFVLVIVAIATFVLILRLRQQRRDLFWLTLLIGLGIPAQAIIGGISVLTKLDPYIVGLHFVVSGALVAASTVLVYRVYRGNGPTEWIVPWKLFGFLRLILGAAAFEVITVILGILLTGSGPHAGDANAPRNGLNSLFVQSIHTYIAFAALVMVIIGCVIAFRNQWTSLGKALLSLVLINLAQIVVGLAQSNLGLPELLVGLHMLLACLVIAAATLAVLNLRKPALKA